PKNDIETAFDLAPAALCLLGPMDVVLAGRRVALPRSKKTRALLAYLAVTGRRHRRDRLCALFWDVTDDPRGALRWSLSRLRQVLPGDVERIVADRDEVALSPVGLRVDACELSAAHRQGFVHLDTDALERLAPLYRGEFLEGLELPDFLDFTAWCIAERDQLRRAQGDLLAELVGRLADQPARALPHARQRAQVDVFNLAAQQDLLGLLLALGQVEEAERRFEHTERVFRQVSAPDAAALDSSWRNLRAQRHEPPRAPSMTGRSAPTLDAAPALVDGATRPFVGRHDVTAALEAQLDEVRRSGGTRVALVTGEPGVGKSRLAERIAALAGSRGVEVRVGRAYEAESSRPFGPWADALSVDVQQLAASSTPVSRDALFDAVRARLVEVAAPGQGVLLVLDDLQWFDRSSAELLHYVVRTVDRGALLVLLLARSDELTDNEDVVRLLRGLRRARTFRQVELEPLAYEDIRALVAALPEADARRLHEVSRGNPLYALELARAALDGVAGVPPTLVELVRERIERLPESAAEALRWGAVLGHAFDFTQIEGLVDQPASALVDALERLEQSALLRIDAARARERYVFAHDLIREAVYSELSQPRRRLMHRKVARLLEPLAADAGVAADVARHASLAGEAMLGVRACVAAGHQSLRMFANSDAEALAKRGIRLADELDEPARVEATLDLLHVLYSARTPDREEAGLRIRELAERALDLGLTRAARQGFQMLSFLRWEGSSLADAHSNILQAERVSRAAEAGERATALAFAARCLVLLERNLQQAEAFVMEADAVARREGKASAAVAFAIGMIAAHRGEVGVAVEAFQEARDLARQQGEHLAEFGALEHHVMLELDQGHSERAAALAESLVDLGGRVRPGAERLNARALLALARLQAGAPDAWSTLREA
ncbi:MAG: AAA family ATPase, partial [Acidobacteriota bacterium]|nr:AAA family ATPase [Acidobacteriota bacterium]